MGAKCLMEAGLGEMRKFASFVTDFSAANLVEERRVLNGALRRNPEESGSVWTCAGRKESFVSVRPENYSRLGQWVVSNHQKT